MNISPSQAIGLFDSGVGGLTVAHAIRLLLPQERLIYFGDTFHLPYGDKSSDSVKYYSIRISDFLLEKNCKVILIACNTASASAYQEVMDHVGDRALVVNVVDPVVEVVGSEYQDGRIGVIGTKGTINSRTYPEKLAEINPGLDVVSLPTPLLVPMIEEGFVFDDISNAIIRAYLSDPVLEGITGLILGCTHYPIIKRQIEKYYDFNVKVVDSAAIVARSLQKLLEDKGLLNKGASGDAASADAAGTSTDAAGTSTDAANAVSGLDAADPARFSQNHFYVSDYTDYFGKIARLFFEEDLELEQIDFWKKS